MSNKVFLGKKGIIHQTYEGDQSEESVEKATEELKKEINKLKDKGKNIKVLTDLSNMGKSTSGSRKAAVRALKNTNYDKIALFGGNVYIRHLANFLIKASGQEKKVRMFKEKPEAVEWLKN